MTDPDPVPTPAQTRLAAARAQVDQLLTDVADLTMQPDPLSRVGLVGLSIDLARMEIEAETAGISAPPPPILTEGEPP